MHKDQITPGVKKDVKNRYLRGYEIIHLVSHVYYHLKDQRTDSNGIQSRTISRKELVYHTLNVIKETTNPHNDAVYQFAFGYKPNLVSDEFPGFYDFTKYRPLQTF